jgi:hypothetical protein
MPGGRMIHKNSIIERMKYINNKLRTFLSRKRLFVVALVVFFLSFSVTLIILSYINNIKQESLKDEVEDKVVRIQSENKDVEQDEENDSTKTNYGNNLEDEKTESLDECEELYTNENYIDFQFVYNKCDWRLIETKSDLGSVNGEIPLKIVLKHKSFPNNELVMEAGHFSVAGGGYNKCTNNKYKTFYNDVVLIQSDDKKDEYHSYSSYYEDDTDYDICFSSDLVYYFKTNYENVSANFTVYVNIDEDWELDAFGREAAKIIHTLYK